MYCEVMWPSVIEANVAGSDRARVSWISQANSLSVGWWWQFSLLLSNPWCAHIISIMIMIWYVSRAVVFLVHSVNLVLFDYKILLTVPLMSLDHVWIVTNAGNCWYHASAPVGMTVIVSVEGGLCPWCDTINPLKLLLWSSSCWPDSVIFARRIY